MYLPDERHVSFVEVGPGAGRLRSTLQTLNVPGRPASILATSFGCLVYDPSLTVLHD